jgi:hypothetical protein
LWFDHGFAGLFITSTLLHLGEDINFLVCHQVFIKVKRLINPNQASKGLIINKEHSCVGLTTKLQKYISSTLNTITLILPLVFNQHYYEHRLIKPSISPKTTYDHNFSKSFIINIWNQNRYCDYPTHQNIHPKTCILLQHMIRHIKNTSIVH